jgi:hypothetical protein
MTKDPREKAQELELDRSTEEHPKQFERAMTGMGRHRQRRPRLAVC